MGVSEGATPRGSALVYPLQDIKNLEDAFSHLQARFVLETF